MRAEIAYEREQKKIAKSTQGWQGAMMTVGFAVDLKDDGKPIEKKPAAKIQKSGNSTRIVKCIKRPINQAKSVSSRQNSVAPKSLLLKNSTLLDCSLEKLNAFKKYKQSFSKTIASKIKVNRALNDWVQMLNGSGVKCTSPPISAEATPNSSLPVSSGQTSELYSDPAKHATQLKSGNATLVTTQTKQAGPIQGAVTSLTTASIEQVAQSESIETPLQTLQHQSVLAPAQDLPVFNSNPNTSSDSITQHNLYQLGFASSDQNIAEAQDMNSIGITCNPGDIDYDQILTAAGVDNNISEGSTSTIQNMAVIGNNPSFGYYNQGISSMDNNTLYAVMDNANMNSMNSMVNTNSGYSQLTGAFVNDVLANAGVVNDGFANNAVVNNHGFYYTGVDNTGVNYTGLANNNLVNNTIVSDRFGNDYMLCQNGTFLKV